MAVFCPAHQSRCCPGALSWCPLIHRPTHLSGLRRSLHRVTETKSKCACSRVGSVASQKMARRALSLSHPTVTVPLLGHAARPEAPLQRCRSTCRPAQTWSSRCQTPLLHRKLLPRLALTVTVSDPERLICIVGLQTGPITVFPHELHQPPPTLVWFYKLCLTDVQFSVHVMGKTIKRDAQDRSTLTLVDKA